ncbi:TetR/AcrR family transcriptional regulator [Actinospica durhamensis]|uniref:TetR/AcrR family transcriptional regulator n=1 Tax=Actinospica durhamensis TaxID=1508375 RepID=A0A941EMA3_9ACTN|nr:TetR/AcrR family transcriptional regulator [Actinospica durhamensis]MBR7835025.1 TetR/AcrR family transcriptional regulator [Actinospica durhamensis]
MRRSQEHKDETRRKILDSAGRLFKAEGIDGIGIAGLMGEAGLTNGAFYKHFASKDELVAHAVADQLEHQQQLVDALPPGRAGIEEFVHHYLSAEHCGDLAQGCPSAALLDEIGRCTGEARQAYTDGLAGLMDALARRLAPHDPDAARTAVTTAFAMMAGSVQIARAITDPAAADALLERAAVTALELFDAVAGQAGRA